MAIIPNEQPTFGFDVTTPSRRVAVSALNLGTTIDDVQLSAIERIADYVWTHYDRTLTSGGGGSGGASASDIWAYATRTLTTAPGLTTAEHNQLFAIPTNPASPSDVTAARDAVIAVLPSEPDNETITTIEALVTLVKAKTDALPPDPADQSELATLIGGLEISGGGLTTDEHNQLFAIPTNPALPADVTAARDAVLAALPSEPDNATIGAIEALIVAVKAKTDALPADTAAEFTALANAITQIPTDATLDQATLTAIAEAVRDLDYISTTSLRELLLGIAVRVNAGL